MSRREELQQQIARLDKDINNIMGGVELPKLDYRPFPTAIWILALFCFAWWMFGGAFPAVAAIHAKTANWPLWIGVGVAFMAFLSTISWFSQGVGHKEQNEAYNQASARARELQDQRRALQAELKTYTED